MASEREQAVTEARERGLEERIGALQEALLAAETRTARLESELGECERERSDLELRVAVAGEALAEARVALDRVHGSRSWRLTAPLRRVVELARGRGGG